MGINLVIAIPIALIGLAIFILEVRSIRIQRKKLSLPESVEGSKVVWGLWHTGARIREEDLIDSTTSIKRILLFDYCNTKELTKLANMGALGHSETDIQKEIIDITKKALLFSNSGVRVRWYPKPIPYSLIICERDNNKINIADDFSTRAFLRIEFFLAKVKRHKRPPYLIMKSSKDKGEQALFNYYVKEFLRIWDSARPINSLNDMECVNGSKT